MGLRMPDGTLLDEASESAPAVSAQNIISIETVPDVQPTLAMLPQEKPSEPHEFLIFLTGIKGTVLEAVEEELINEELLVRLPFSRVFFEGFSAVEKLVCLMNHGILTEGKILASIAWHERVVVRPHVEPAFVEADLPAVVAKTRDTLRPFCASMVADLETFAEED